MNMSSGSRCSSSALSPKNRSKAERDRIKAALEKVSRDARERRLRSSPSVSAARARAKYEETKQEVLEESKEQYRDGSEASINTINNTSLELPQSPGLSDMTNCTITAFQSKEDLKNHQYCEQITTAKKSIDPRREWELAPLKEALKLFCQSDEIFERPHTSFQPPPTRGTSGSTTQQQTFKLHHLNKHSILPLLQQYANDKTKVGVQTQTDKRDSHIQCQSLDMSNNADNHSGETTEVSSKSAGDRHYNESFPTYDESLSTTAKSPNEPDHLHSKLDEEKIADNDISSEFPSYNESFPSYSYSTKGFGSSKKDDSTDKNIGSVTTTSDLSKQSKKGCAWVIDIKGFGEKGCKEDGRTCKEEKKTINTKQPERRNGSVIDRDNEDDASIISEDEYDDSSFLSDD